MDAVFEFFMEFFIEILFEAYYQLMSLVGRDVKKIKKEKLKMYLTYEMLVLLALFCPGLFLSIINDWTSVLWKTVFIISLAVPAVQIAVGLALTLIKKIRKK